MEKIFFFFGELWKGWLENPNDTFVKGIVSKKKKKKKFVKGTYHYTGKKLVIKNLFYTIKLNFQAAEQAVLPNIKQKPNSI